MTLPLVSVNRVGSLLANSTVDCLQGACLVALGRAHCQIATLQEAYGLTFRDTFIASCDKYAQDIKDYEYQRKKLDSRR